MNRRDPISTALLRWHRREGPITFLQLGSNDGVSNDPLHQFVLEHGWKGFAVEPVPWVFNRLQQNHAAAGRVICINAAVGLEAGTAEMYTVRGERPGDPFWVDQISSFDRNHVLAHAYAIPELEARIVPINVPVTTVDSLWEEVGRPAIDLLHIDIEGGDAEILGSVPYDRIGIRAVLYEHIHMNKRQAEIVRGRFRRLGFRTKAETPHDRLVMR